MILDQLRHASVSKRQPHQADKPWKHVPINTLRAVGIVDRVLSEVSLEPVRLSDGRVVGVRSLNRAARRRKAHRWSRTAIARELRS
jgi:hypothetical protein